MRFDDRLDTVLKGPLPEGIAASLQWRQVIDLMAQKPGKLMNSEVQLGLTRLRDLHDRVSEADRLSGVRALEGRLRSAPLLVYLCADSDTVREAALNGADIADEEMADILPQIGENARDLLALRADIGPHTREMLGLASREIPSSEHGEATETEHDILELEDDSELPDNSQISALVDKISAYQQRRGESGTGGTTGTNTGETPHRSYFGDNVERINFETDDSGTIIWTEGPPPGAVVGVSIAEPTFDDGPGPDAYGSAAFRQRMPLESARMRLCGAPIVEGDWRMTAIPYFGEETGRFKGYRGIMRRPNAAEDVRQNNVDTQRREQLQQLVHELRTPLNAIIGFSEIIEQQLFGPVSSEYRTLSRSIMDEAQRLLAGFEDLDIAAKIDAGQVDGEPGTTEPSTLFERLSQRLQSLTESKAVDLHIKKAEPVRAFAHDPDTVERVFARLLSAVIIACENGEQLHAELRTRIGQQPMNYFTVSRPARIMDIAEADMLDPSQGMDDEASDAPLLGLGFSLRLVRNLARGAGGSLVISDDHIGLIMPALKSNDVGARETENE